MPYAIVVLDETLRPRLGDAAIRTQVDTELAKLLQDVNAALAPHERLHRLVVAREPWSIDNGCLTPTLKIKRSKIESAAAPQLDAWYTGTSPVLWA